MNKTDAERFLEVIRNRSLKPTTRLLWLEIRLSELFDLNLNGVMTSSWMRRENTRRLEEEGLLLSEPNTGLKSFKCTADSVGIHCWDSLVGKSNGQHSGKSLGKPEKSQATESLSEKQLHIVSAFTNFNDKNTNKIKQSKYKEKCVEKIELGKAMPIEGVEAPTNPLKWKTMAELFCKTIQDCDGFRYHKHLKKWETQFRLLHEEDGIPSNQIWTILKWYCSQRVSKTDSKLPRCFTANMFRGAFGWIKQVWETSGQSMVEIDEKSLKAAASTFRQVDFDRLPITKEALARLYSLISIWKIAAQDRVAKLKNKNRHRILAEVLDTSSEGISFQEQVGLYLFERVKDWKEWAGNLDAFKPGGHEFIAFLQVRALRIWQSRLRDKDLKILLGRADAKD